MPIAWTTQIINQPLHLASHVAEEILIDDTQWLDVLDLEVELPYEIPGQEHLQSREYLEEVILEAVGTHFVPEVTAQLLLRSARHKEIA